MTRFTRAVAVAALAVVAAGAGTYGFYVLRDDPPPQRSGASGARPRPSTAPTTGRAVPRPAPPVGVGRTGPGPVVRPRIEPSVGVGFWYDWPYPYGYPPYGYPPYGYPWSPAYPFAMADTANGSLRINVSPKDAAVYVDGYYAGIVDDFNGVFHHLALSTGPHVIEVRKTGFDTLTVEMYIQSNQAITYRDTMHPAQPASVAGETGPGPAMASTIGTAPAPPGDLRFDVTPKDAQVYVDGYYVGIVDDFEGRHQRLNLIPGPHHVELQAHGYEPVEVDVTIESRQTTTYRGTLTTAKSGS